MTQERGHNYSKQITFKQFNILDEDEQIVEGYVTDDKVDVDGHVIDQGGFRAAVQDYMSWGNIREQHMLPAGMLVDTPEWNKFIVRIVDDNVWKKVKAGLYKGFSVGIRVLDYEVEPIDNYTEADFDGVPKILQDAIKAGGMIIRITKMVLAEVSIVDRPANPRALVTAFKAEGLDNTETLPVFKYVAEVQKELKGDNQMAKTKQENTEIEKEIADSTEAVVEDAVVESTEEDVTEGTEDVSLEVKFASLEQTVNDLTGSINEIRTELSKTTEEFEKTVTEIVTKALESVVAQTETEDVAQAEEAEVVEDEVAETESKSVDVDVEAAITSAFKDIEDRIANAVAKAIADQRAEDTAAERQGGINGGDVEEDVDKSVDTEPEVPTLRKAAYAAFSQIRHTNGLPQVQPE